MGWVVGKNLCKTVAGALPNVQKCELFRQAFSKSTRCTAAEMEDEGVGGWLRSPGTDWCTQPSPQRGSPRGLEWVSAPLRCVGIADWKTQWSDFTGGSDAVSSSSGLHHREICVREHVSSFLHARPQKAA